MRKLVDESLCIQGLAAACQDNKVVLPLWIRHRCNGEFSASKGTVGTISPSIKVGIPRGTLRYYPHFASEGTGMGHYCRICGCMRPNEQFPGKGHKIHVCKRCQSLPKSERRAVEDRDDIFGFMHQSHISNKNVARLEQLAKSETLQVASLAAIVLEVARVTPYKRRRVKILARNHRELLRRLAETSVIFAHTWDWLPAEVFAQTHLEETEFSVKEGEANLLAPD